MSDDVSEVNGFLSLTITGAIAAEYTTQDGARGLGIRISEKVDAAVRGIVGFGTFTEPERTLALITAAILYMDNVTRHLQQQAKDLGAQIHQHDVADTIEPKASA